MAWPWPFRIVWGHDPSYYDTDTAQAPGLWRSLTNVVIDPTGGYLGAGALTFGGSPSATYGPQEVDPAPNMATKWPWPIHDQQNLMMGSRFWLGSNPGDTTPVFLVINPVGFVQASLNIDTAGHISVWSGLPYQTVPGDVELWNSSEIGLTVSPSTWHRLGWIISLQNGTGWFDVYLDRVQLVYSPGHRTFLYSDMSWTGVGWGGSDDMKHSHLYVGSGVPEYQAHIRRGGFLSIPRMPIADGTYTGGTSTEATHYQALNETPPDDAATRVDLLSVGQKYSLRFEDLVGARAILGVQDTIRYSRPEDSAYALRQFMAINDVVYPATTLAAGVAGDWGWNQVLRLVDPSNNLPFTRARLNSETVTTEEGALVHASVSD